MQVKKMRTYQKSILMLFILFGVPGIAAAHVGTHETSGIVARIVHTLTEVDHVLALVVVGLLVVQLVVYIKKMKNQID
jgi:hydrogenase/urease accessory protein HupE